mmetsp:Transcript_63545/g.139247  ORF Transcript_63545/g.139247 Transcript_63545/m.139247 type:complete len:140 (-) Transcript_63545:967-1386(-)
MKFLALLIGTAVCSKLRSSVEISESFASSTSLERSYAAFLAQHGVSTEQENTALLDCWAQSLCRSYSRRVSQPLGFQANGHVLEQHTKYVVRTDFAVCKVHRLGRADPHWKVLHRSGILWILLGSSGNWSFGNASRNRA